MLPAQFSTAAHRLGRDRLLGAVQRPSWTATTSWSETWRPRCWSRTGDQVVFAEGDLSVSLGPFFLVEEDSELRSRWCPGRPRSSSPPGAGRARSHRELLNVPGGLYPLKSAAFEVDEYRIMAGWPVPVPDCDIRIQCLVSAEGDVLGNRDSPTALITEAGHALGGRHQLLRPDRRPVDPDPGRRPALGDLSGRARPPWSPTTSTRSVTSGSWR